jgi:hypothetical protein
LQKEEIEKRKNGRKINRKKDTLSEGMYNG